MNPNSEPLELNLQQTTQEISAFLVQKQHDLRKDGVIIGLSGGLDSAVVAYLAVRALGRQSVRLLNLPERDSKAVHRRHAALVASQLGVELQVRQITSLLQALGAYKHLPTRFLPGRKLREILVRLDKALVQRGQSQELLERRFRAAPHSLVARGKAYAMAKHRLRMVLLYDHAEVANLMVVGAANRTELLTGSFTHWGCDQCADVMPILHLYRSQLPPLAEYLGVPQQVRSKPADPDILPGVDDKEALLGSFERVDRILYGLENGSDRSQLVAAFGQAAVQQIESLYHLSRPMRESPYHLLPDP